MHNGPTDQARRLIKAMQDLGIARKNFSVRTETQRITDPSTGHRYSQFGDALVTVHTKDARKVVADNTQALADQNFSVTVIEATEPDAESFIVVSSRWNWDRKVRTFKQINGEMVQFHGNERVEV